MQHTGTHRFHHTGRLHAQGLRQGQGIQATALVDVDEIQAHGVMADTNLTWARFAHRSVNQSELLWPTMLMNTNRARVMCHGYDLKKSHIATKIAVAHWPYTVPIIRRLGQKPTGNCFLQMSLGFVLPSTMFHTQTRSLWFLGLGLLLSLAAVPIAAQTPTPQSQSAMHLRIVGGLASINQFTKNEEPFWSHDLARLSGGKYSAEIVPFDRAGVPGNDMLRLLELGVVPFGTTLMSGLAQQYPQYAALDLAGLNPDMASLKKNVAAFRPYLENDLRQNHNIEMLALYTYPAQVLFCKKPFTGLGDIVGRHVRVSSPTQSDFVTALGAVPVVAGFAQIMTNMNSGNTDCAITGTMSGNTLGLHRVTSHIHSLPITWGLAIFGANKTAWDALAPDLKALLSQELPRLEASIWAESERETTEGLLCNTGQPQCKTGHPGTMLSVPTTAKDERLRQQVFNHTVLTRWLARCNGACAAVWSRTIGRSHNPSAALKP
jgi:TRAP-type C4-dicarboxylate transport system substrate-binding protein